jgi:hypothetical protein
LCCAQNFCGARPCAAILAAMAPHWFREVVQPLWLQSVRGGCGGARSSWVGLPASSCAANATASGCVGAASWVAARLVGCTGGAEGEDAAPADWARGQHPVGEAAGGAVGGCCVASAGAVGGSSLNAAALSSGGGAGSVGGRSKTLTYSPDHSLYTLIVIGNPPSGGNNFTGTELVSVLTSSSIVQLTRFMLRSLSSGLFLPKVELKQYRRVHTCTDRTSVSSMVLGWCPCKGNRMMEWCGGGVVSVQGGIRAVHTLK